MERKRQKDGEVGDRNLDLPQSARCKADALPLSYIPSDDLIDEGMQVAITNNLKQNLSL